MLICWFNSLILTLISKLLRSVYVIVLISPHKMVIPPHKMVISSNKMVISSNKRENKPTNTVVSLSLVLQKIRQDDLAESPKVDQEADQDTSLVGLNTIPWNHGYEPHKLGYKLAGTWCKKSVNNWDTSFSDFQTKLYVVRWKSWVFVVSLKSKLVFVLPVKRENTPQHKAIMGIAWCSSIPAALVCGFK